MPTKTYKALANITLSTSAASVTFGSIPSTYRDLVLVVYFVPSVSAPESKLIINSDTGQNYPLVFAGGDGSSPFSVTQTTNAYYNMNQIESGSIGIYNFMDYSATDKHKTILHRTMRPSAYTLMQAGRWASTNAITQLAISPSSGNWNSGSTFALYGIDS